MNFPSICIDGVISSGDLLDKLDKAILSTSLL
jgi:hypothetical protein